jgi:cytidylate kinase
VNKGVEEDKPMSVITISRQFGAGGWTLGERLAKRLGYRYVQEDMIKEVAAESNVSASQIKTFEKRGPSKLMKFLDKMVTPSYVDRLSSDKYGFVDEDKYVDVVRKIILDIYEEGNAVIIGRGSQYVLQEYDDVWKLLLLGNLEYRIDFVMNKFDLSRSEAENAVKRRDQIRGRFLSFFKDAGSHNDPLYYDMVLNMTRISMDQAEEMVLKLVHP